MGINKDLGLPFGDGMERVAVCFDVDGTLLNTENPKDIIDYTDVAELLYLLSRFKNVHIIVWSGGGKEYAETMYNRHIDNEQVLGVNPKFYSKLQYDEVREKYDKIIAIDDVQDTRLGDINLIVRNK